MRLIRHQHILPQTLQNAWVTIGNFDGMHLGHQALLTQLKNKAKQAGAPCGVIIFEPQPQEFFSESPPARLSTFRQKYQALKQQGIDFVLVLRFNATWAQMGAEDFVAQVLVNQLHIRGMIIGQDFRFGHHRKGDFALLQFVGKQYGFTVTGMTDVTDNDMRISSTQIRALLAQGNLRQAAQLLGHPFALEGKVMTGDARGRTLGMRTANIALHRKVVPLHGIFVVSVHWREKRYKAVASLGRRPVFNGQEVLLEVHLLDFNQDIYGERLEVALLHKLRDEKNFNSVSQLAAQMQQDLLETKKYWEIHHDNQL